MSTGEEHLPLGWQAVWLSPAVPQWVIDALRCDGELKYNMPLNEGKTIIHKYKNQSTKVRS